MSTSPTSIETKATERVRDADIYNLMGVRVSEDNKDIVIQNGTKYLKG